LQKSIIPYLIEALFFEIADRTNNTHIPLLLQAPEGGVVISCSSIEMAALARRDIFLAEERRKTFGLTNQLA
jgi:hypothetical protein